MTRLNNEEKTELLELRISPELRQDMRKLHENTQFLVNGKFEIDRWLEFLNQYNEFINHQQPPFRKIKNTWMRL